MMNSRMCAAVGDALRTFESPHVSKIPKWRAEKLPPIDCPKKVSHNRSSLFTRDELSDISQPPPLGDEERKAVWKVKAQRKELDDHLKGTVAHIQYLKRKLKETKVNIEKISTQLNSPQVDSYEFDGECDDQTTIVFLAKENLRLQRDLLENLDLEEKLTTELETAQRELRGAELADHYLSMEVEEKLVPVINQYDKRKSFLAQKRALREKFMKHNAEKLRKKTLNNVVSVIKQKAETNTKKSQVSVKVLGARNARRKVDLFIRKTMHARHQQKLMESADEQFKQDRQHKLLAQLKQEMDDQKDTLIAMSQAKKKKEARAVAEKERIRQELTNSGKNPYYVEHLLAIEEKRAQQQRKMLEKEQERLTQLQREYEISEKVKHHEEIQRKKWDDFWAKKVEERKKVLQLKQAEFYDEDSVVVNTRTDTPDSMKDNYNDYNSNATSTSEVFRSKSVAETVESKSRNDSTGSSRSKKSLASSTFPDESTSRLSIKSRTSSKSKQKIQVHFDETPDGGISNDSEKRSSSIKEPLILDEYEDIEALDLVSLKSDEYTGEFDNEIESRKSRPGSLKSNSLRRSTGTGGSDSIIRTVQAQTKYIAGGDAPSKLRFVNQFKQKVLKKEKKPVCAFRWQPNIITFSDYEVGKTYKKVLTVTNVSTQRAKFYLKSFNDLPINPESGGDTENSSKMPITDLMHVNFQISKTLSPGLTHDVSITFKPPVLEDWKGVLKFESSTIPFEVNIQCFKKRFVPVLSSVKAVFTNVVANTNAMISIKLKNTGAKAGVITQIVQTSNSTSTFVDHHSSVMFSHQTSQILFDKSEIHHKTIPNSVQSVQSTRSHINPSASGLQKPHHIESKQSSKSARKIHTSSKRDLNKKMSSQIKQESPSNMIGELLNDLVNSISNNVFIAYVKECKRDLEQDSFKTISLIFRPPCVDTFKSTFDIYFDDPEVEKLKFNAVGDSMENPIFLNPLNTDFRICMMDHNYQQPVIVSTTIRGAGKVSPEVPKELQPFVEVSPKEVTVFPKNPGRFSVKFRPGPKMFATGNPALKYIDTSSMIIDFPVSFHLKFPYKLSSPLTCTFMAVLTNQSLEFFPAEIDMGKCSSIETVQASFSIFNNCMLPQEIGFVDVPECISIQPNFGFATLLPHEKRDFSVILSLPENSRDECIFILKCQTLQSRLYNIPVRVFAKMNNIQLSQTRIFFPVTAVGSVSTTRIEIFSNAPEIRHDPNNPGNRAKFEFYVAPHLPLTVLPRAGYIEPKKAAKIQILFDAQVSEKEVRANLMKVLERDHIDSQGMLQRELDGINETLKYEMVFGEGDFDEEFLKHLTGKPSKVKPERKKRKSGRESLSAKLDKRSSFVNKAPNESNIRLSIDSKQSDPLISDSQPKESGRRGSHRKSKDKEAELSTDKLDSERQKKKSIDIEPSNKRKSSGLEKSKRKSTGRSSKEPDQNETPNDKKLSFMVEAYKMLEKRKDELIELLAVPYTPPNVENVETGSKEYSKAKKDLVKHLGTSSHIYSLPCFVTDEYGEVDVHILIAKCPMSHPSLTLLEESNTFDFGNVAVGSKAYREVHLFNVSHGALKIKMDVLNPYGAFVQCNALRKVPPDHVFTLKLRFQPEEIKNYEDSVRIFGGDSRILINLKGVAVAPEFNLKPTKSEFYVGTIKVGAFGFQEFEISNSGSAELTFNVDLLNQGHYEGTSAVNNESDISNQTEGMERTSLIPGSPLGLTPPPSAVRIDVDTASKPRKPARTEDSANRDGLNKDEEIIPDVKNEDPNPKRKSRTKSMSKRKTHTKILSHLEPGEITSTDPTFEIKDGNAKRNLKIKELITFLEKNNKQYFFQSISSSVLVPPGSSKKFSVFFVPVESGRYFAEFQVRLYQTIVHRFSIVGVGETTQVAGGEFFQAE